MFVPVIELTEGKAVSRKGDGQVAVERDDPVALARELYRFGQLALIDLDAADGSGDNTEIIYEICQTMDCLVGGGITDFQQADLLLRGGARQLIVGNQVNRLVLERFPRQRLLVALDDRTEGYGLTEWRVPDGEAPAEVAASLARVCSGFVYGLGATETEKFRALRGKVEQPVMAVGDLDNIEDIKALDRMGVDCLLGFHMADSVDFAHLFADMLDFETMDGILPTIVQDSARQVLGHFVSNHAAVVKTLKDGLLAFWRHGKGEVTVKKTSGGETFPLVSVHADPRRRVLLYTVKAPGAIDPSGSYSMFGERTFSLETLEEVLKSRLQKPPSSSYTQQILVSRDGVVDQIVHQAKELAQAEDSRQVVFETADLIYYVLINLVREKIPLTAVFKELRGRAGRRRS